MIKNITILFILLCANMFAQNQNEWINYDQNYFKFPIAKNGVYRIDLQQLVSAGININGIDPRNFQIFAKGEELAIYIQGESDGVFDANDFIEFYAEGNDGWYDHELHSDSSHVFNHHISMFTDSLYYFLTWNNRTDNKRLTNEFDLNFDSYPKASYYWNEVLYTSTNFNQGKTTPFNWAVPEYSEGEGRYFAQVNSKSQRTYTLETPHPKMGVADGWIKTKLAGTGNFTHFVEVNVNDSNVYNGTFVDRNSVYIEETFPNSLLSDNTTVQYQSVTPIDEPNSRDKFIIAYMQYRYASEFNLNGVAEKVMFLPASSDRKQVLEIENYDNLNSTVRLYDLTSKKRIQVQPLNGKYLAIVPRSDKERKLYLTNENTIRAVGNISPVSNSSSNFIDYESLLSQKGGVDYIAVTGTKLQDAANEYAAYREANGLLSISVDVEQLYHQYAYGIRKNPLAIKNFCKTVIDTWNHDPQYLFLIGKSITMNYSNARYGNRFEDNIVPTWSVLGTDVGFTKGIKSGSVLDPVLATGRLAATTSKQVSDYLEKVKQYESAVPADWMKQILHFGGGVNTNEQGQFSGYLEDYEAIIEDSLYGGFVHTFLKNSSDPLQINLSDSVKNLINKGVSLMTFFGHAYGNNFDQSIEEPENYENTGRYPFILANSCLIGNIHTNGFQSGSERFVLADQKGAIGFLGSSSLGVPTYLNRYSNAFYDNLSRANYGESVGVVMQQTIKQTQDSLSSLNRDVSLHMTLHCDPAIVLNTHSKPDYSIFSNNINTIPNAFFTPEVVSSETDSFTLSVIVKNIGKAFGDTFDINVTRNFPNQGYPDTTYVFRVSGVFYSDTINLKMPVDKINGVGFNTFTINVDPLSEIDELNEFNNRTSVDLFINSSDIVPVFPYEFAVVDAQETILKASTGTPYAPRGKYYFQIDTSNLFNSPRLTTEIIESEGGVISWDPASSSSLSSFFQSFSSATTIEAPVVFFWRVSSDSTGNGKFIWKESSFQHVATKTGWGQSHFHQQKNNDFQFIDYNFDQRVNSFIVQNKTLTAQTHLNAGYSYRLNTKYEIDGSLLAHNSMHWDVMFFVVVVDKNSLEPWHCQEHGDYGHVNYIDNKIAAGWNEYSFYFPNRSARGLDSMMSFINDVPDSNYVCLYSFRGNSAARWLDGQPISSKYSDFMTEVGASVDSLKNYPGNYPYILFFQKGDSSTAIESFSPDGLDYINLRATMRNNWFNGKMNSKIIGPSTRWESLHWELKKVEQSNSADTAVIKVYGLESEAAEEVLLLDSLVNIGEELNLAAIIDANIYPYLKLETFFADDVNRTPDELVRWQVLFDEVPEVAINPLLLNNYVIKDSVEQGEDLLFITAIQNISNVSMDSLQVSYRVIDDEFRSYPFTYSIKAALAPGEFLYDTVRIATEGLIGDNNIWYEINPFDGPREWELEQYHFNNLYLHKFNVNGDEINPILDVTFDGVHLLDGDIVKPNPNIVITLDDENQFLTLDNAELLQLYIRYPTVNGRNDSVVLIDPNSYTFTPASLPKNKCTIEFKGNFTTDGMYELQVLAKDRSNNVSGAGDGGGVDYKIGFEIVTESSISHLINYPNPFSTSTRFVFTLTGSEVPDNMLIQIMTISGKVVREITKDELGPIAIGRNITEFAWDGTDEFGDQLANGVYLYKVSVQMNGQELKRRTENLFNSEGSGTLGNKYFTNNIGKMYLLR